MWHIIDNYSHWCLCVLLLIYLLMHVAAIKWQSWENRLVTLQ